MSCSDRISFEKKHHAARERFDATAKKLHDLGGISSLREYVALHRESDLAWQEVLRTRSMLNDHIREHSCLSQNADAQA
jgi:hypothetical protein